MTKNVVSAAIAVVFLFVVGLISLQQVEAQPQGNVRSGVALDSDDIGGMVRSPRGPEAGVWVIAETRDLPTKFARIVVTDAQGRYVVPDLPKATYEVWVRGYGLVDSPRVRATPGQSMNLSAVVASTPVAAAQYYPAAYWYSMIQVPPATAFPMDRHEIRRQSEWIYRMKSVDVQLIQIGDKATREIPERLGRFRTSREAWEAWLKVPSPPFRLGSFFDPDSPRMDRETALSMYANWTDRIAAGEVPPAPPRPQGVERNLVITLWDWADNKAFVHDAISTDKRDPTVNANGPIYGVEQFSSDMINILDPVRHVARRVRAPQRDPDLKPVSEGFNLLKAPMYWGEDEIVFPSAIHLHNPMLDHKARLWMTVRLRTPDKQPAYCKDGSPHPSAQVYPLNRGGGSGFMLYDPKTDKFTDADTCVGSGHLQFASDADHTLWGGSGGWINTRLFDETGDISRAHGWCPFVLDTNGNGKLDPGWASVTDPVDPTKDKAVRASGYGLTVSPLDGSVWLGGNAYPGYIARLDRGNNPPSTCLTEIYHPPAGLYQPKSIDIDRDTGVIWAAFSTSGHFASFDRRKCKVLNGPTATGNHCPEGWTVYPVAPSAPTFQGVGEPITSDYFYLNWVDQFDTLGLGRNVPVAPGSNSDSVVAFLPEKQQYVVLRVPYPLGFYARGMDGRIDDPKAGWKGKGMWTTYSLVQPWHKEGGKDDIGKVVKLQMRPDPLAH